MANYQYSQDLLHDALFRSGEPTDGTSDYDDKALEYLNRVYQALWLGGAELDPSCNEEWSWLLSTTPGTITIQPIIETGTITVTNNSAAIVFSSAPAASVAGWFFRVNNTQDIFRIATHTAASVNATLDSVYTTGSLAGAGYRLMRLDYTLSADVLRLISPMRVYRENRREIKGASLLALERRYPLVDIQTGVPWEFAQVSETTVRFSHCGSDSENDYIRVDYDYLKKPAALTDSASEEPIIPLQRRRILSDFVTYFLMLDKNDDRADAEGLMAKSGLRAMAIEHRRRMAGWTSNMGKIMPRAGDTYPVAIPRTESGLIIG